MRNLLATIGGAVVLFLGLGWYLGWYYFAVKPNTSGALGFEGEVKTDKIKDDAKKFGETVSKATSETQPKAGDPTFVGPPMPSDMPKKPGSTPNSIPGPLPGPK